MSDLRDVTAVLPTLSGPGEREAEYRARGWWPGGRLVDAFAALVDAATGHLAVADSRGRELTRRALWERADVLAGDLARHGVGPGHAVVLMVPNVVEFQVAFLALLRRGAVGAPIPMTTDRQTLSYIIDLVGAHAVIAARRHGARAVGDEAVAAAAASGAQPLVLTVDPDGEPEWPVTRSGAPARHPDWVDQIMFTSSTTGRPKGVMHSADTLAALNIGFRDRHGIGPDAPIFMPSPLGHSVGTIHGARLSLFTGAPLVLQERWDPIEALELSERHRCAFTAAATPFLKDLVDAQVPRGSSKMPSLRTFLCGGAPVPPALMARAASELPATFVTVLWGMTEGGVTTCPPGASAQRRAETVGQPLPGLELRIIDPVSEEPVADGPGELSMRGPGVFLGYAGQDDLYRSLLTADGFFRTGDLAEIDDDGYLHITGRLKDLIIRGGVNLSPVPLENCLAAHPAIAEVAVVGLPDERLGERICAVVVPAGDAAPTLDDLVAWIEEQGLSRRLWPEALRVVGALPKTAAGKIRKHALREELGT